MREFYYFIFSLLLFSSCTDENNSSVIVGRFPITSLELGDSILCKSDERLRFCSKEQGFAFEVKILSNGTEVIDKLLFFDMDSNNLFKLDIYSSAIYLDSFDRIEKSFGFRDNLLNSLNFEKKIWEIREIENNYFCLIHIWRDFDDIGFYAESCINYEYYGKDILNIMNYELIATRLRSYETGRHKAKGVWKGTPSFLSCD